MRCPYCGAGLTCHGKRWYCKFCHQDIEPEAAKCRTLDKYNKEGDS